MIPAGFMDRAGVLFPRTEKVPVKMDSRAHGQQGLLGSDGQHFKMEIEYGGKVIQLVFNLSPASAPFAKLLWSQGHWGKAEAQGAPFLLTKPVGNRCVRRDYF